MGQSCSRHLLAEGNELLKGHVALEASSVQMEQLVEVPLGSSPASPFLLPEPAEVVGSFLPVTGIGHGGSPLSRVQVERGGLRLWSHRGTAIGRWCS